MSFQLLLVGCRSKQSCVLAVQAMLRSSYKGSLLFHAEVPREVLNKTYFRDSRLASPCGGRFSRALVSCARSCIPKRKGRLLQCYKDEIKLPLLFIFYFYLLLLSFTFISWHFPFTWLFFSDVITLKQHYNPSATI